MGYYLVNLMWSFEFYHFAPDSSSSQRSGGALFTLTMTHRHVIKMKLWT